jgi:ethanolamine ammonia-lyase small subunit
MERWHPSAGHTPSFKMETPDSGGSPVVATMLQAPVAGDPWRHLAAHTDARIALGRSGGSLRTSSLLAFNVAHAQARDAVHQRFDEVAMELDLKARGFAAVRLSTASSNRAMYLARPDLGRRLAPESADRLRGLAASLGQRDLAVIVSDGLSAASAVHAAETAVTLMTLMAGEGWSLYPVFVVPFARVKVQDEIGGILGARHSIIFLGERPGLSAHDSLGAYLTFSPRPERNDADRNCVSNIRGGGLAPAEAARKIARLLVESRRLGLSGTALRDR